jgi:long-chain fatty acid transport protein
MPASAWNRGTKHSVATPAYFDKLRIGLTYQSPIDYKFGFRLHLTDVGPLLTRIRQRIGGVKINIPMEIPQQVMASAVYQVTRNFSLMGSVSWQNWSAFGEFPIGISAANQTTVEANLHFSDTYQLAIGQQLRLGEKWLWSAGFAYDSSPVSKVNRLPTLPLDRQLRYGTGVQYEINRDMTVGAAWEFMDGGPGSFQRQACTARRNTAEALLDELPQLRQFWPHSEILALAR